MAAVNAECTHQCTHARCIYAGLAAVPQSIAVALKSGPLSQYGCAGAIFRARPVVGGQPEHWSTIDLLSAVESMRAGIGHGIPASCAAVRRIGCQH